MIKSGSRVMRVEIPHRLLTVRAPRDTPTPWLTGRATRWMVAALWPLYINGKREEVPAGYVFNGSSIPWPLWWLFPPSYAPAWEAACWHDHCYSHLYHRISKREADAAFRQIMLDQGAAPWVANVFHAAVSRFGRGGW